MLFSFRTVDHQSDARFRRRLIHNLKPYFIPSQFMAMPPLCDWDWNLSNIKTTKRMIILRLIQQPSKRSYSQDSWHSNTALWTHIPKSYGEAILRGPVRSTPFGDGIPVRESHLVTLGRRLRLVEDHAYNCLLADLPAEPAFAVTLRARRQACLCSILEMMELFILISYVSLYETTVW